MTHILTMKILQLRWTNCREVLPLDRMEGQDGEQGHEDQEDGDDMDEDGGRA